MKFIAILLFCFLPYYIFAQWQELSNWGQTESSAITEYKGVLYAGINTGLYRSTDSGIHWEKLDSVTFVQSIAITERGTIFVLSYIAGEYFLYTSHDAGLTWRSTKEFPFYDQSLHRRTGFITQGNYLYLATDTYGEGIYRRHEDEDTWQRIGDSVTGSIYFLSSFEDKLWISASEGIFSSSDLGFTWAPTTTPAPIGFVPFIKNLIVKDSLILALISTEYQNTAAGLKLWRSTDAGNTWQQTSIPAVFETVFIGDNHFFAITNWKPTLYRSSDGIHWEPLFSNTFAQETSYWKSNFLQSDNTIFMSHAQGIATSTDEGVTWQLSNTGFAIPKYYPYYYSPYTVPEGTFGLKKVLVTEGRHFSTDGGQVWKTPVYPSTSFRQLYFYDGQYYGIAGNVATASLATDFYRSDGDFTKWEPITTSGISSSRVGIEEIIQVGKQLFLTKRFGDGTVEKQLHRSDDGGISWRIVATFSEDIDLITAHKDSFLIIIERTAPKNRYLISGDGGQTWQPFAQTQYDGIPAIIESYKDKLYIYAQDYQNGPATLSFSEDRGASWHNLVNNADSLYGSYLHAFIVNDN
ncbi:MAG: hypothetical protein ACK4TA_22770 [Saprospiraceae bacterium]